MTLGGTRSVWLFATLALLAPLSTGAQEPLPAAPGSGSTRSLAAALDGVLRSPAWNRARGAALVISLDRGDTLYALNPDLPLAPASNLKLWSTAAALYYLGSSFRYTTRLWAEGPIRDGVLLGDLVLSGNGDPAISDRLLPGGSGTLAAFADSLARLGVREVRGDVVGDASAWDRGAIGLGWNPADRTRWYAAPAGPLSFAEDMLSVTLAARASGVALRTSPATEGIAISNRVRAASGGATTVRWEYGPDTLFVRGQLRTGTSLSRALPVADPANYAAAALRAALATREIRVTGGVRTRTVGVPSRRQLIATHLSPRLDELIRTTNHVSHNGFADALLKTAGEVATGQGSWNAGRHAVRVLAAAAGADSSALEIHDGSGLSRLDRVTARANLHLLAFMAAGDGAAAFRASLPQAGNPQGLKRMYGTPAAGNLRAKTGTIRSVSALSGYVRAADGERLAFSILVNGVESTASAKRVEDAFAARLAAWRR